MNYLCLDVGNVLCTVDEVGFIEFLSYKLNVSTFKAKRFLKRFQQLHDLGFTTMEDELMDQFNIKSQPMLREVVAKWNDSVVAHNEMIQMLALLKDKYEIKTAILSNIGVEHAGLLSQKLDHMDFYNQSIKHLSCYVGARKPSTIYFQSFLMSHPEFKGALYVDDLQTNLDGATPLGFQGFRFSLA